MALSAHWREAFMMITEAKGISGSSFVSCFCCSAESMCTPACQKPVPHLLIGLLPLDQVISSVISPAGEKQTHQTWICKSLWIRVWGAESVLSFSLAGPLVPLAMDSESLTFMGCMGTWGQQRMVQVLGWYTQVHVCTRQLQGIVIRTGI